MRDLNSVEVELTLRELAFLTELVEGTIDSLWRAGQHDSLEYQEYWALLKKLQFR